MFNLNLRLSRQTFNSTINQQQIPVPAHNALDLASSKSKPKYSRHSPSIFAFPISQSGSHLHFANLDYNSIQLTSYTSHSLIKLFINLNLLSSHSNLLHLYIIAAHFTIHFKSFVPTYCHMRSIVVAHPSS